MGIAIIVVAADLVNVVVNFSRYIGICNFSDILVLFIDRRYWSMTDCAALSPDFWL